MLLICSRCIPAAANWVPSWWYVLKSKFANISCSVVNASRGAVDLASVSNSAVFRGLFGSDSSEEPSSDRALPSKRSLVFALLYNFLLSHETCAPPQDVRPRSSIQGPIQCRHQPDAFWKYNHCRTSSCDAKHLKRHGRQTWTSIQRVVNQSHD